jgi:hypothetical protein
MDMFHGSTGPEKGRFMKAFGLLLPSLHCQKEDMLHVTKAMTRATSTLLVSKFRRQSEDAVDGYCFMEILALKRAVS